MLDEVNDVVRLERRGDVAIIKIDNPPINAGSTAVRRGLLAAVNEVTRNEEISGAILIGAGRIFMAGSDMREFHAPVVEPHLTEVICAMEDSPKPIVAAIAGSALGGGYELALGCDARIATPDAVVGLPECLLGMMPGAGGTQRLPRLVGMEKSIDLICSGTRVRAAEAAEIGMVDAIADGDLLEFAVAYLSDMGGKKHRITDLPVPYCDETALEDAKLKALKLGGNRPNFRHAIEAIENSLRLHPIEALSKERAVFLELRAGREAAALCHLFFADRDLSKREDRRTITKQAFNRVAVVGGETSAVPIAAALLRAGRVVTFVERAPNPIVQTISAVRHFLEEQHRRGEITSEQLQDAVSRLNVTSDIRRVADVDLVVEAAGREEALKTQFFALLGQHVETGIPFLSISGLLPVSVIAEAYGRANDVVGISFLNRPEDAKLVEIVRHPKTDAEVVAAATQIAKAAGARSIVVRDSSGSLGYRIRAALRRECDAMVEEGVSPSKIERALKDFGFKPGAIPTADNITLVGAQLEQGPNAPETTSGTVVNRVLAAIANEASLAIAENLVDTPADIDLLLTREFGFPRHEGGIVFWAKQQRVSDLEAAFRHLRAANGSDFKVGTASLLQA